MKKFFYILFLSSSFLFAQDFAKHVNPFIGTGGHGHTFPGATVPYGMVQLSPDTRIDGSWDGCSGYHYSDSVIYGFSHTHLNGTGVSDYGDIMLMPTMGEPSFDNKVYSSPFSHANEKASAGFYSVKLDKHNIDVRLTTSTRIGFHEYTFNKTGKANIILDLNHRDKLLEGEIRIIDQKRVWVKRRSEAWARDQYVFALIEFEKPIDISKVKCNGEKGRKFTGTELALSFSRNVKKGEKIRLKVTLSNTGFDGTEINSTEIQHWDFNKAHKAAIALWNKELSKIEVTSDDKDKLAIFYTALYHTMMQPNIAQDIDGKYRGRDNQIHLAEGFDYYTVFSLWDTFRAAHPLYTLIDKKRTADYINTFIKQYEQGGRLPVWELASNETDCMIGYHSVSVIADAMVKGIEGFDYEKAYEASKASAMRDVLGLEAYKRQGFISIDDDHESVSKTVEYAYDDWCIGIIGDYISGAKDNQYFKERSQNWKNLFDWEIGFIRPKKNGGWDKPFDPREVNNNFTEGNAWQYTFFVPQDIQGMIEAYGGPEKFEAKLDEMFNSESKTTGREQVDVTGLIGQYAHGNEPSHHMAYLYNYVGKPEKTKEKVHFILENFYKNTPDGLIGNEDCGQMSAWYILSSMGIYSVTPGSGFWATTEPFFDQIKLNLEGNRKRTITKSTKKLLLQYLGTNLDYVWDGQALLCGMGFLDKEITPVPVFEAEYKSFKDSLRVEIKAWQTYEIRDPEFDKKVKIEYAFSDRKFKEYTEPININETKTIFARAVNSETSPTGKQLSRVITATYYKKPNNYTIAIKSKYNPQYHAGGPDALLDGIYGNENWRKGEWQGYQNQDFEAVIDLLNEMKVSELSANFLQDTRAWILMPTQVEFYVSSDNKNFTKVATVENKVDAKYYEVQLQKLTAKVAIKARYVKVIARNFGALPEWHQGFGYNDGNAFIFIDEIEIK